MSLATPVIDFNKAVNPPCAFSVYATCPLPPRENILPVAIAAGERYTATGVQYQAEQAVPEPAKRVVPTMDDRQPHRRIVLFGRLLSVV